MIDVTFEIINNPINTIKDKRYISHAYIIAFVCYT